MVSTEVSSEKHGSQKRGSHTRFAPKRLLYIAIPKSVSLLPVHKIFGFPMYQLKITLRDSKPPIWRRVLVPKQITLNVLHQVIQLAFGWNDEHLYMFEKGRKNYPVSDYNSWGEYLEEEGMKDAKATPLWATLQHEGERLIYTYDFGDWWDFIVLLEKCFHDTNPQPITCLRGKGTTPVENAGGQHRYNELLLQVREAGNPEQAELHGFLMQDIERRRYDPISINDRLKAVIS